MTGNQAADLYLRLRAQREAPPSASGFQLERMRDGVSPVARVRPEDEVYSSAELLFMKLVFLFEVLQKDEGDGRLTLRERDALLASRLPRSHARGCDGTAGGWNEYNERTCACGATKFVKRSASHGDYVRSVRVGEQDILVTFRGEHFVAPTADSSVDVVEGAFPVYQTPEALAQEIGVSRATFFRLLQRARSKVENALPEDQA